MTRPALAPKILAENDVSVPSDSRWQSRLRLLQSLWRKERNLDPGKHNSRPLGSRLEMPSAERAITYQEPDRTVITSGNCG